MGSFVIEEFVGNGVLKQLVSTLLDEGWDDVPALKMMNSEDMDAINMTQKQKEALEIRSYLHDRALLQYGDKLEASGKTMPELLAISTSALISDFGMKRGHIARFTNRTSPCEISMPPSYVLPARKKTASSSMNRRAHDQSYLISMSSRNIGNAMKFPLKGSDNISLEQSISDIKLKEGHVFKGTVGSDVVESRGCGCVQTLPAQDVIAPYSAIENISVQKLTPEYKIGMEQLVKTKTPPMKASDLWRDKPAILLCIRRPGCIMCRAEAHQLYARKPIFDAIGVQLVAVLHEQIESEVKDFWPRYWGGVVVLDKGRGFFKALGGGKLLKENFIKGFLFNPRAIANYKRAKALGVEQNFKGEGEIKGGLYIVGSAKRGIAYQFIERNFGDWAPMDEVISICSQLQKPHQSPGDLLLRE